jgi:hypothetical protein
MRPAPVAGNDRQLRDQSSAQSLNRQMSVHQPGIPHQEAATAVMVRHFARASSRRGQRVDSAQAPQPPDL